VIRALDKLLRLGHHAGNVARLGLVLDALPGLALPLHQLLPSSDRLFRGHLRLRLHRGAADRHHRHQRRCRRHPRPSRHVASSFSRVEAPRGSRRYVYWRYVYFGTTILFRIGGSVFKYWAIATRSALVRSLYPASVPSITSPMRPPATSPSGLLPLPR